MTTNLTFGILGSNPSQFIFAYQKHEIEILCMVLRWKRNSRSPSTSHNKEELSTSREKRKKGALIADYIEEGTSIWEEERVARRERERERERDGASAQARPLIDRKLHAWLAPIAIDIATRYNELIEWIWIRTVGCKAPKLSTQGQCLSRTQKQQN
jgi:hypothetical protein